MVTSIADDYPAIKEAMREVRSSIAMDVEAIPDSIRAMFINIAPTGSRYICDPPPIDTDSDWIALLATPRYAPTRLTTYSLATARPIIESAGFEKGGSEVVNETGAIANDSEFMSFKRGQLNLIITPSLEYFDKFLLATRLAKQFNLLRKDDRIALFTAIVYGERDL